MGIEVLLCSVSVMKDLKPMLKIKISRGEPSSYYMCIYTVVHNWVSMSGEQAELKTKFLKIENSLKYTDSHSLFLGK